MNRIKSTIILAVAIVIGFLGVYAGAGGFSGPENAVATEAPIPDPTRVLFTHDQELFEARFHGRATDPLFADVLEHGVEIKVLLNNEAAALAALHEFARTPGDRGTWDSRGYRFRHRSAGEIWSLIAEPIEQYKTGVRSFYVDETLLFRASIQAPATCESPVVGEHEAWTTSKEHVRAIVRKQPI